MPMVVGVIVRRIKDKVYAQTGKYTVNLNDKVILETEHGTEFGVVCEKEKNIDITIAVILLKNPFFLLLFASFILGFYHV